MLVHLRRNKVKIIIKMTHNIKKCLMKENRNWKWKKKDKYNKNNNKNKKKLNKKLNNK